MVYSRPSRSLPCREAWGNSSGVAAVRSEGKGTARLNAPILILHGIGGRVRVHARPASVIVATMVTGTSLPFGGHKVAGVTETIVTVGGVVSFG